MCHRNAATFVSPVVVVVAGLTEEVEVGWLPFSATFSSFSTSPSYEGRISEVVALVTESRPSEYLQTICVPIDFLCSLN